MRFLLLLFSFIFIFACNTSSINKAYTEYYNYQKKYISALLDNNKQAQIKYLKEMIECGEFLHLNITDYKKKLQSLSKTYKPVKNYPTLSKHIKILSYNPIKIKLPSNQVTFFTSEYKLYKKVFDIKNAAIHKFITKKLKSNIILKIAQFNKNTVRIVLYSKYKFRIKYRIKNNLLTISIISYQKNLPGQLSAVSFKPIKKHKKVIVIDPGHGGKDAGGVGIKHRMEKEAVLKIAKYLKIYLQSQGYIVYLTRKGDYFIPLKKRTHFANIKKADLFISIHCNIAPRHYKKPHGIETYFLSPTRNERAIQVARTENKEIKGLNYLDQRVILNFLNRDRMINSNKLAIDIQKGMLLSLRKKYSRIKDGGVRPAPFWVLVGTQMPAILIETGYLTNPLESKRLFNPEYQKNLAKGIAEGIKSYFKKNP
ncbi:MAG: N-acetylmuramoyl-L-alanine amidase [Nautiliaceae bacterium]